MGLPLLRSGMLPVLPASMWFPPFCFLIFRFMRNKLNIPPKRLVCQPFGGSFFCFSFTGSMSRSDMPICLFAQPGFAGASLPFAAAFPGLPSKNPQFRPPRRGFNRCGKPFLLPCPHCPRRKPAIQYPRALPLRRGCRLRRRNYERRR